MLHQGETTIAVDENNPQLYGCNKCVFEKKLERPRFLVAAARRIKKRIDVQHQELAKNLEEVEKLDRDALQQRIQNSISSYFNALYRNIKEVEKEVISQIKASTNLMLLNEAIDALHKKLNHTEMAKLDKEKKKLDARVESQRYTYIAMREEDYNKTEKSFQDINTFLNEKIDGVRQYERDFYAVIHNYEEGLFNDVFSIVGKSFRIDKQMPQPSQQALNRSTSFR